MKITVSSSELSKRLQFLSGVINSSNTLPILDNFLFEIENDELKITSSDLETTMSTTMEVEFKGKASVAVPAKLLIEVLKTFPEQPLVFNINTNNTIEIVSESGNYEIAYAPGEEFPKSAAFESPSTTLIPSKVLANAINKTLFSAGNDALRAMLSGVYFEFTTEKIVFVATDAHKLVKYTRNDIKSTEDASFIVPKKPLSVLKSILSTMDEEVTVSYNTTNAIFTFENYIIACRLIDEKFPKYEAVIPKENPNKLIIDRSIFTQSVKRVSTFSNKATHQIILRVAGTELNLYAEDADYSNKADERLTCNYEGDDLKIGFNSRFLTEMLGNINSTMIQLEMSIPTRAGILTPIDGLQEGEEILMLVMPVKV